jgi:hypothetical protein
LVVKELLAMDRCSFLCGDARSYIERTSERFDVCFACGILYHMVEPIALIDLVSWRASMLLMWTHYSDAVGLKGLPIARSLGDAQQAEYDGFGDTAHRHRYGMARRLTGFWGGNQPFSRWLPRGSSESAGALRMGGHPDRFRGTDCQRACARPGCSTPAA